METVLEAVERLRTRGYHLDLSAVPNGRLRCGDCGDEFEAATAAVDETVRFEGQSNPDDEAVLVAVTSPCGHRGVYTAPYGVDVPIDDVAVLIALARRH